jgi:hypothetical protein
MTWLFAPGARGTLGRAAMASLVANALSKPAGGPCCGSRIVCVHHKCTILNRV